MFPVGSALAVVMVLVIWAVSAAQTRTAEAAFKAHLTSLAAASRFMIHSAAADYCRSRGMVFHRVLPGRVTGSGPAAEFERAALRSFERDPTVTFLSLQFQAANGDPRLYVLASAILQDECRHCHSSSGMALLEGRRNGAVVGAFGVSMSMAELHRSVAATRLLAGLIGLAVLAVVTLVVSFFVHRSILRPLAALSGSITLIAEGDLTAQAPVQSHDELGRLAETFNRMVAQLNQANHAYMEMLAFVSHELKNPIASMITDAEVLADGYLGSLEPRQVQKLVRLMGSGRYLLGLIRDYLDLARMEGGKLALQPKTCGFMDEVVEPAVELILPQLQARNMSLERHYVVAPRPVQCDPDLLRIVLVNLLGNAVKYGQDGGILRLGVACEVDRVGVSVWNQGPGFPAEERPRLFRKFSRLRVPEFRELKGTGVGLYTAWRIIQMHGGNMDARSEAGQWAEFSLEFPQPLPAGAAAEGPRDPGVKPEV